MDANRRESKKPTKAVSIQMGMFSPGGCTQANGLIDPSPGQARTERRPGFTHQYGPAPTGAAHNPAPLPHLRNHKS